MDGKWGSKLHICSLCSSTHTHSTWSQTVCSPSYPSLRIKISGHSGRLALKRGLQIVVGMVPVAFQQLWCFWKRNSHVDHWGVQQPSLCACWWPGVRPVALPPPPPTRGVSVCSPVVLVAEFRPVSECWWGRRAWPPLSQGWAQSDPPAAGGELPLLSVCQQWRRLAGSPQCRSPGRGCGWECEWCDRRRLTVWQPLVGDRGQVDVGPGEPLGVRWCGRWAGGRGLTEQSWWEWREPGGQYVWDPHPGWRGWQLGWLMDGTLKRGQ